MITNSRQMWDDNTHILKKMQKHICKYKNIKE